MKKLLVNIDTTSSMNFKQKTQAYFINKLEYRSVIEKIISVSLILYVISKSCTHILFLSHVFPESSAKGSAQYSSAILPPVRVVKAAVQDPIPDARATDMSTRPPAGIHRVRNLELLLLPLTLNTWVVPCSWYLHQNNSSVSLITHYATKYILWISEIVFHEAVLREGWLY